MFMHTDQPAYTITQALVPAQAYSPQHPQSLHLFHHILHEPLTGATIFPVCPTCMSLLTKPASTAALDAPTAAFRRSARSYSILKFSPLFMPRPENKPRGYAKETGRYITITCFKKHGFKRTMNSDYIVRLLLIIHCCMQNNSAINSKLVLIFIVLLKFKIIHTTADFQQIMKLLLFSKTHYHSYLTLTKTIYLYITSLIYSPFNKHCSALLEGARMTIPNLVFVISHPMVNIYY